MSYFCPKCNNLLYFKEEASDLYKYCTRCGYKIVSNDTVIDSTEYKKDAVTNTYNSNAVYDDRLARTTQIPCVNNNCPNPKDKGNPEVVLIKNKGDLRSKYMCSVCKTEWA